MQINARVHVYALQNEINLFVPVARLACQICKSRCTNFRQNSGNGRC